MYNHTGTLNAKGCVGIDGDQYFVVPAFHNIPIVDTTGAGDVFHGAFIFGLLQVWNIKRQPYFQMQFSLLNVRDQGGALRFRTLMQCRSFCKPVLSITLKNSIAFSLLDA